MKKSLIIALVAATLGLAGCQKDDSSGASDTTMTNGSAPAAAPAAPAAPAEPATK